MPLVVKLVELCWLNETHEFFKEGSIMHFVTNLVIFFYQIRRKMPVCPVRPVRPVWYLLVSLKLFPSPRLQISEINFTLSMRKILVMLRATRVPCTR